MKVGMQTKESKGWYTYTVYVYGRLDGELERARKEVEWLW